MTGPRSAAWWAVACAVSLPLPRYPGGREIRAAQALFVAKVVSWHRILPGPDGTPSPLCTCGVWAVTCAYLRLAHDLLGHPVPWDPDDPPPAYVGA